MLVFPRFVLKHLLLFSSCDVTMFVLSKSLKSVARILRLFGVRHHKPKPKPALLLLLLLLLLFNLYHTATSIIRILETC